MREIVRRNAIPSAVDDLEIVAGVLGERAELLGALALVMHESDRFAAPELISGGGVRERENGQTSATHGRRARERKDP